MKRFTLLAMGTVGSLLCHAQNTTRLTGSVISSNMSPIEGATVKIKEINKVIQTDKSGQFSFESLRYGDYTLHISFIGFLSYSEELKLDMPEVRLSPIVIQEGLQNLNEISVNARKRRTITTLDDKETEILLGGKKSEMISVSEIDADISQKNSRQIFAKIPGVFVYDMDGSGNQVNISTRGLDPHRSWEFNVRLDNVITNSDMYGYPASHFSMPMESIERIEIIRGTGSLQYGAQFGGMLNYVSKKADTTKSIGFESMNSIGSYGLKSTYNAVGGRIGKFQYYAYFSKRVSDGFRVNAESDYESEYLRIEYLLSKKTSISGGLARSVYMYRIPGPLTEEQFQNAPRQSSRSRNFYTPDIFVPYLKLKSELANDATLNFMVSAVLGERKSVQFTGVSGVADEEDPISGKLPDRQVDIDQYHSYTSEFSYQKDYPFLGNKSTAKVGVRLIKNNLSRRQKGVASEETGATFEVTSDGFGRDLHYYTENLALFFENQLKLNQFFSINLGVRYENGVTRMRGRISDYPENELPTDIKHAFPLIGADFNYQLRTSFRFYGGISQAYRPVIFADIIPTNNYERTDKSLKDSKGYNAELGLQGELFKNRLSYNVTAFALKYNNRMGKQAIGFENENTIILRTNIGNSLTYGLEAYIDATIWMKPKALVSVFSATSLMKGEYLNGSISVGYANQSVDGNSLPGVPGIITRNGVTVVGTRWSTTFQYSYTSGFYSDPLNTEFAENGTVGLVPGYGLFDLNGAYRLSDMFKLRLSLSNLTNKIYFTKRPTGYPGPGIWTSDGRSIVLGLDFKI